MAIYVDFRKFSASKFQACVRKRASAVVLHVVTELTYSISVLLGQLLFAFLFVLLQLRIVATINTISHLSTGSISLCFLGNSILTITYLSLSKQTRLMKHPKCCKQRWMLSTTKGSTTAGRPCDCARRYVS